jgi:uncharacterized protein with FMN-binding domain
MKQRHMVKKCLAVAAAASCLAACLALAGSKELDAIAAIEISDLDFSRLRDGTYEGFRDYKLVTARVRSRVEGGKVVELVILEHSHGPKHGADALIPKVLETQSLRVDAVTGSTASSKVLLETVEAALSQGL